MREYLDNDSPEQMFWDFLLVDYFFTNASMGLICYKHIEKFDKNTFYLLRRTYYDKQDINYGKVHRVSTKQKVSRFVSAYIPKLAEKLYDGNNKGDIKFWLLMNGEKINTLKVPYDNVAKEFATLKRQSRSYLQRYGKQTEETIKLYESYERNNQWNVCK